MSILRYFTILPIILALVIIFTYAYNPATYAEGSAGILLLLGLFWFLRRRTNTSRQRLFPPWPNILPSTAS